MFNHVSTSDLCFINLGMTKKKRLHKIRQLLVWYRQQCWTIFWRLPTTGGTSARLRRNRPFTCKMFYNNWNQRKIFCYQHELWNIQMITWLVQRFSSKWMHTSGQVPQPKQTCDFVHHICSSLVQITPICFDYILWLTLIWLLIIYLNIYLFFIFTNLVLSFYWKN